MTPALRIWRGPRLTPYSSQFKTSRLRKRTPTKATQNPRLKTSLPTPRPLSTNPNVIRTPHHAQPPRWTTAERSSAPTPSRDSPRSRSSRCSGSSGYNWSVAYGENGQDFGMSRTVPDPRCDALLRALSRSRLLLWRAAPLGDPSPCRCRARPPCPRWKETRVRRARS